MAICKRDEVLRNDLPDFTIKQKQTQHLIASQNYNVSAYKYEHNYINNKVKNYTLDNVIRSMV